MKLLKKNWCRKEAPKSESSPDRLRDLRKEITVIRKQGEPPVKDPHSFAQYVCDLYTPLHPVSGLRQCTLYRRWACNACRSCAGMIKIHQMKG